MAAEETDAWHSVRHGGLLDAEERTDGASYVGLVLPEIFCS
jgi:hypothetical protein